MSCENVSNVCPVPKKGDLSIISNYRPISLLDSENKVFERLVFKYLFNHFRDNNLLSSFQSGFLPGDSTVNQLTFLYNTFCQALDSGKEVRAVFCDISEAFDRVWHSGLICKLLAAGVIGEVLAWFKDYLKDREHSYSPVCYFWLGIYSSWSASRLNIRSFIVLIVH